MVLIQPGGDLDGAELTLIFYPKSFKCRGLFKVVVFSLEAEKEKKVLISQRQLRQIIHLKRLTFFLKRFLSLSVLYDLCVSVSICLSVSLSLSHTIPLFHSPLSLNLSLYIFLSLSHSLPLFPSFSLNLSLSLSQPLFSSPSLTLPSPLSLTPVYSRALGQ